MRVPGGGEGEKQVREFALANGMYVGSVVIWGGSGL